MTALQKYLFTVSDQTYASFQLKLIPGLSADRVIGVRVPILRAYAKQFAGTEQAELFLRELPHTYFEEDLLHAIVLGMDREYSRCLSRVEQFLPFVNNWSVCDTLRMKVSKKDKNDFLSNIEKWVNSSETYTCRFGIEMLMVEFLDSGFSEEYLEIPLQAAAEEYYVMMMIALYYATALAKQWQATIPYLEENRLDIKTHNKTIQKAIESRRITEEQKQYLKTLKR